jgi:hypothetical protein
VYFDFMKLIPIILGAATVTIVSFVIKTRLGNAGMNADLDTTRPAAGDLPMQQLQNDKLIIVKGVDYTD